MLLFHPSWNSENWSGNIPKLYKYVFVNLCCHKISRWTCEKWLRLPATAITVFLLIVMIKNSTAKNAGLYLSTVAGPHGHGHSIPWDGPLTPGLEHTHASPWAAIMPLGLWPKMWGQEQQSSLTTVAQNGSYTPHPTKGAPKRVFFCLLVFTIWQPH